MHKASRPGVWFLAGLIACAASVKAAELTPESCEMRLRAAELLWNTGRTNEAIVDLCAATELEPQSAKAHALLGYLLATQERFEEALTELRQAEPFVSRNSSDDYIAHCFMCRAYSELNNAVDAVRHFAKLIELQPQFSAISPSMAQWANAAVQTCRSKLPPASISDAIPKTYSEKEFQVALRQKLSSRDLLLVTNPLAITPPMQAWANQLTVDTTNDMQKARALYEEIKQRTFQSPAYFSPPGTAQQVFQVWDRPDASFRCQELTYLYVTLARAVGLRAYFVFVEEDFRGQRDYHACPAVVFGAHMLLFDPACWVGVIHKKFTVLNDVQTIALHLSASNEVEPCAIACRLAPELSIVQEHLFDALRQRGRRNEAKPHLEAMIRLDPEGGLTYYGRALLAMDENKFDEAIDLLGKGIETAPQREVLHLQLGDLYLRNRKWVEAQQSYRAALNCPMDNDSFRWANALLAIAAAEECRSKNDLQGSLTNFNSAISSRPEYPEPYVYRGLAKQSLGDFEGASKDFETAISLKPELSKLIESLTGSQYPVRASSKRAFANQIAVFSAVFIALLLGILLMTRKVASKNSADPPQSE